MNKKPQVGTHNGKFHTDDVFAVAALQLLLGEIVVVRTRDEKLLAGSDYVVDVGGVHDASKNRFDHHQAGGAGKRGNGIPYAAFGLLWQTYGENLCGSKEIAEAIDRKLVQPIDADDNGFEIVSPLFEEVYPFTVQNIVSSFLPTWKEKEAGTDEAFLDAVQVGKGILHRLIVREQARKEAEVFVRKAYDESTDKRIIVLPDAFPWKETILDYPEPLFVVFPREDGLFHVNAVPQEALSFKNRLDLPAGWAGKREDLKAVTGVPDAVFCHNGRFMVVAASKEGAMKLAELAIKSS